jgi:hypothetical protein
MTGTSFEPAITYFLDSGKFAPMAFGPMDRQTDIAETHNGPLPANLRTISVSGRYDDEPFAYFTSVIGQEILHGNPFGPADEVVINFLTAMVMDEQLASHPELAYLSSELARRMNDYAMMFLNSRRPSSAQNVIIAPDGVGNKDVWSNYHGLYPGSTVDTRPRPSSRRCSPA